MTREEFELQLAETLREVDADHLLKTGRETLTRYLKECEDAGKLDFYPLTAGQLREMGVDVPPEIVDEWPARIVEGAPKISSERTGDRSMFVSIEIPRAFELAPYPSRFAFR